jgi:hypothetical protein
LIPGAAGTLGITGTVSVPTLVKIGKKFVTRNILTPFTTNVSIAQFDPGNESAMVLDNFNSLNYVSPGFLNNEFSVTNLINGAWQIAGQVNSPFFPPAFTGKLQFNNINQLTIDTTRGATSDIVQFTTGTALPAGLKHVTVAMGTGADELDFNDSTSLADQNYIISPSLVLATQPLGSLYTGVTYSGVETLSVTGTQGNNKFFVTPSKTTSIIIDGQDPPFGTPNGDTLAVHTAGTTGAFRLDDGIGGGQWTFTSAHKTITFSNIETAIDPVSNSLAISGSTGSAPLVKVYDAVTKALQYEFYAYDPSFKGGVNVSLADLDGDMVPDIIVAAPGPGTVPNGQTGQV